MPGKRITCQQYGLYMKFKKSGLNQSICAAKAGFSERSGRNLEKRRGVALFTKNKNLDKVCGASKQDKRKNESLEVAWRNVLLPLLEQIPNLTPRTLQEHLQDTYPGQYPDSTLRTMQRRVSQWKALHGAEKEVIFRQVHTPGRQGLSDFTSLKDIEITIGGKPFAHLLYHFRLAYSCWSCMRVIQGGESFTALSRSLQDALFALGGVPLEHRTDSLSAAFKNLSDDEYIDITKSYNEVCSHYSMEATRNNRGKGHENGSVESAHGHLKRRLEQALLLRGSYDFESIAAYQKFVDAVVTKHNNRHQVGIGIELPYLQALPKRRAIDFTEIVSRVTTSSTISVKNVMYSVPSRLIGRQLKIHIYDDLLSCYLGADHVLDLPRIRLADKKQHARCINYRHIINSLSRKPGAFSSSILRDDILPNVTYKNIWAAISKQCGKTQSSKLMVGILKLASDSNKEEQVGEFVLSSLISGQVPTLGSLQNRYLSKAQLSSPPTLKYKQHQLSDYNHLLPSHGIKEVASA